MLTADFSTTTAVTRVASQISIMEAMESYFECIPIFVGCGIPEITLEGTPEHWQKVLDKTRALARYDLKWWTDELEPLLEEFVRASQGKVDRTFWQAMFKYHTQERYGAPNIIDGWIIKFFPYDKDGKRNNLKELVGHNSLPEEIVKVDLKHIELDPRSGKSVETPLELWAGFIGLEQNGGNFALTPKIGWMIRKKDVDDLVLRQSLEANESGIRIRVGEIPRAILNLEKIEGVMIQFTNRIIVPDELAKVKIMDLASTAESTATRSNGSNDCSPIPGYKSMDRSFRTKKRRRDHLQQIVVDSQDTDDRQSVAQGEDDVFDTGVGVYQVVETLDVAGMRIVRRNLFEDFAVPQDVISQNAGAAFH